MSKPDLTTYGGRLRDLGYAGQLVDMATAVTESKINDQSLSIDFGVAVARSAADDTCKAPTADGDKIIGISIRHAIRPADTSNNVVYAQRDSVPIAKDAYIWVVAYENAVRGDTVISVTAQNGKLGSSTGGAAGAGRVTVPGAPWDTTTAAGAIGKVRIAQ
jgi:hypothetical protein